jgi:hypothetical protein
MSEPWRTRPAEPTVEGRLAELDALRAEAARLRETVARVEAACASSEAWHRRYDLPLFGGYIPPPTIEIQVVRRALTGEGTDV